MTGQWPEWAERLRDQYLAGEASTFVLYGNVFDLVLHSGQLLDLKRFLVEQVIGSTKATVVEISAEFGVTPVRGRLELDASGTLLQKLHSLEAQLRTQAGIGLLLPYAQLLVPGEGQGFVSSEERLIAALFHRWSLDRKMQAADNITILLAETLGSLDSALVRSPKVSAIELPMPDLAQRAELVAHLAPTLAPEQVQAYARRMAGLRGVQIEGLLGASAAHGLSQPEREAHILQLLGTAPDAKERAARFAAITAGMTKAEIARLIAPEAQQTETAPDSAVLRLIQARKRELIEKECAGLIEFVEPKHGLSAVGGCEPIKAELAHIARHLREGDRTLSPMGLLAVGPMGAGKTFVIKAFLKEAGLAAVALKNFRSKWVGATEGNLERVLATVKAMGPIAVLIDEGDRSFGNGGGEGGDDGTSSRVIARLKEFMSDTENRGQVLFVMLTNRPDKLDTDIKRPGRLDRKIPFFYCETAAERAAVMAAVLSRHLQEQRPSLEALTALGERLTGYSNADLEQLALLAIENWQRQGGDDWAAALQGAADDFLPPQEQDMLTFMELLAVSETSRKSMLPARFQALTAAEIQTQLRDARRRALSR